MSNTRPASRNPRRRLSPLLLSCALLAAAAFTLPAEASLPRAGGAATVPASFDAAAPPENSLLDPDEIEQVLTRSLTLSLDTLNTTEDPISEPPELTSRACEVSFSLHLEPVNFGLNLQRGPPLEIPDLHQGWFVADPKTRIGGFRLVPEDLIGGERRLSLELHRGYEVGSWEPAEEERPDPWGLETGATYSAEYRLSTGKTIPPLFSLELDADAIKKEAAATLVEESSWVGPANGISGAILGYDFVRREKVEGLFPRFLMALSVAPGIPSSVKQVSKIRQNVKLLKRVETFLPNGLKVLEIEGGVSKGGLLIHQEKTAAGKFRTVFVEGEIAGSHPKRPKGYRPTPEEMMVGDQRGHMAPEGGAARPETRNVPENLVAEASGSNLGVKKSFDLYASRVKDTNPSSTVITRHRPFYKADELRPYEVLHEVLQDNQVVYSVTIQNK